MFSVIIPLYNKEKYIARAVQSVLAQTYSIFELIIVNDGSTDKSLEVIQSFNDDRIRIIDQANQGVSIARNNGAKFSKYNYVAFLDADDWWKDGFLDEMGKVISEFPAAAIYGCNYFYVKHGRCYVEDKGFCPDFKAGYIDYFKVYSKSRVVPFNCSFVIVQKQIFTEVGGFNPVLRFGEDFDLWVRMTLQSKVAYLNMPLAYSNQDVENSSRALGLKITWKKEEHVIYNLDYLMEKEKEVPELHSLLNYLRVLSLITFHLMGMYKEETNAILKKIDFHDYSFYYRFIYKYPKWLVKIYFRLRVLGSAIKRNLTRSF